MFKNMTSERATVLTSAVVAIVILGAAVTAQPSRTTAIERLQRLESDLRYQLDLESRFDPAKADERRKTLDGVIQAWEQSPRSEGDYKLMVEWLRGAIRASMPGESGQWPAAPALSSRQVAAAPEHEVRKEAIETPAAKEPAVQVASPRQASQDNRSRSQPQVPRNDLSTQNRPAPAPATAGAQKSANQTKPFITHISDPVTIGAQTLINDRKPAAQAWTPTADAAPSVVSESNEWSEAPAEPPAAEPVVVADWPAPTADQTAAAYQEPSAVQGASGPTAQPAVEVNLAELNARIGGYHDGLREIEAALVASRDGMTEGDLTKLVGRLEELAGQYEFIQMYYGLLTREERHFVIEPRSMAETVNLVDRKRELVELMSAADHFAAADESGESELAQRLRALREFAAKPGKQCCDGRP
jgi:hypothetical protein